MGAPFFHPTALVETTDIGDGTNVWAFAHVMKKVKIGKNCNIGDHCFIESGAILGDNVTLKNGNMVWEGVTLEDGVFVGPHVFFTNDRSPRSPRMSQAAKRYQDHSWFAPTLIKQGASLGAGCIILPGVIVGEFAMIGAGAVVTTNTPAYAIMTGNPARLKGWVCQCGIKLAIRESVGQCSSCGLSYEEKEENGARTLTILT